MELIPLKRSAAYDEVEQECKALFLNLYGQGVNDKVDELALYGMPHIGPASLIERGIAGDGLAVLRTTTFDQIRYLYHAWRYKNPQRGTAFLNAYLRALFGPVFTIDQLWCRKAGQYPVDVMSEAEMQAAGEKEADYFLTSRLRVDIETEIVPERILKAARTAVAARFVLELRAARRVRLNIPIVFFAYGFNVARAVGTALYQQPPIHSSVTVGPAITSGAASVVFSPGRRLDMQTFRK
ncbi:hypothetical protein [Pseudomonas atacamensis]|uniref:hypothetical protein n=1 Tax=Pseudomonas atacamensis TaxID=2565368 RepID=UPI0019D13C69|nr:hypothetical protein [Pseudomonas atacamensis]QSL90425.1 hypothetical protein JWU58_26665 [Pseudomonas atacamensis]